MAWIVNKPTEWFEATFLRQKRQELEYSWPVSTRLLRALDIFTAYAAVNCFAVQKEFYCVVSRIINGNSRACANNRRFFPPPHGEARDYRDPAGRAREACARAHEQLIS